MRRIATIAQDVISDWKRPSVGAVPYIIAMKELGDFGDYYGCDSGEEIVRRFLSNAGSWRGDKAREVKAELKAGLKAIY